MRERVPRFDDVVERGVIGAIAAPLAEACRRAPERPTAVKPERR
jgi:hypothetical protein